jgi:hypothetical protein
MLLVDQLFNNTPYTPSKRHITASNSTGIHMPNKHRRNMQTSPTPATRLSRLDSPLEPCTALPAPATSPVDKSTIYPQTHKATKQRSKWQPPIFSRPATMTLTSLRERSEQRFIHERTNERRTPLLASLTAHASLCMQTSSTPTHTYTPLITHAYTRASHSKQ